MVEDRTTDGRRIAQLLASELSGRGEGPLGSLSVVDADRDAEPTQDGTIAYRIAVRDEPVAAVSIYPDAAELGFEPAEHPRTTAQGCADLDQDAVRARASEAGLQRTGDGDAIRIASGAAVKRAVDALSAGL